MEGQVQVVRSKKNTPQPHWHQPADGVDMGLYYFSSPSAGGGGGGEGQRTPFSVLGHNRYSSAHVTILHNRKMKRKMVAIADI
jgi:hypothetical protein